MKKRSRALIATTLVLAVLFTGCASVANEKLMFLPRDKKDSMRTIGVVPDVHPELAMDAYKKDEQKQIASSVLQGAGAGFGGALGIHDPLWWIFLPFVPVGATIGGLSAAGKLVPDKRAEEIVAAVLPALSDFPVQERMVEQIVATGTSNTEYNFLNLHSGDAPEQLLEDVDTRLEISVLSVGLYKVEDALQLRSIVRARLVEKGAETSLALRTFVHEWRAFSKKKPEAGDKLLTREEVDGYLQDLSVEIVDAFFLQDDYSVKFPILGYEDSALLPTYPRPKWSFFGSEYTPVTVDSVLPRLEWAPFPSKQDNKNDSEGRLREIGHVSYDLRIWRMAEEEHHPVELAYERKDLVDPWHTVEQPLEHGTNYYWAVRARFTVDGHTTVTRWTLSNFTGFHPMKGSLYTSVAGLYRFSTPK